MSKCRHESIQFCDDGLFIFCRHCLQSSMRVHKTYPLNRTNMPDNMRAAADFNSSGDEPYLDVYWVRDDK